MNIQEMLAMVYDERRRRDKAIAVLTGVTDQPKQRSLPTNPFNAPLRLSADEKKRIANARRTLRAQQKRVEKIAGRKCY